MPTRMDSMISRGKGKVKSAKAALAGLVGVFKTLAEQHGEVSAFIDRVSGDADKRADLWPRIRMELLSHERGEVQELYPVLRSYAETRQLADHHDDEARELEQLIGTLDATAISSDAWGQLFEQLAETVKHHATEEENDIFPVAQKTIGKERAKELESKFLTAKQQIAATV